MIETALHEKGEGETMCTVDIVQRSLLIDYREGLRRHMEITYQHAATESNANQILGLRPIDEMNRTLASKFNFVLENLREQQQKLEDSLVGSFSETWKKHITISQKFKKKSHIIFSNRQFLIALEYLSNFLIHLIDETNYHYFNSDDDLEKSSWINGDHAVTSKTFQSLGFDINMLNHLQSTRKKLWNRICAESFISLPGAGGGLKKRKISYSCFSRIEVDKYVAEINEDEGDLSWNLEINDNEDNAIAESESLQEAHHPAKKQRSQFYTKQDTLFGRDDLRRHGKNLADRFYKAIQDELNYPVEDLATKLPMRCEQLINFAVPYLKEQYFDFHHASAIAEGIYESVHRYLEDLYTFGIQDEQQKNHLLTILTALVGAVGTKDYAISISKKDFRAIAHIGKMLLHKVLKKRENFEQITTTEKNKAVEEARRRLGLVEMENGNQGNGNIKKKIDEDLSRMIETVARENRAQREASFISEMNQAKKDLDDADEGSERRESQYHEFDDDLFYCDAGDAENERDDDSDDDTDDINGHEYEDGAYEINNFVDEIVDEISDRRTKDYPVTAKLAETTDQLHQSASFKISKRTNPYAIFFKSIKNTTRRDRIGGAVVEQFCHNTPAFAWLDTGNLHAKVLIRNDDDTASYHHVLVKQMTTKEALPLFLASSGWKDYVAHHTYTYIKNNVQTERLPTMSLRLFQYLICPCVQSGKQRSCANALIVDLSNGMKALATALNHPTVKSKLEKCIREGCFLHQQQNAENAHRSVKDMQKFLFCQASEYADLTTTTAVGELSSVCDQEAENIEMVSSKLAEKGLQNQGRGAEMKSRESRKTLRQPKAVRRFGYRGGFRTISHDCANFNCQKCGLKRLFGSSAAVKETPDSSGCRSPSDIASVSLIPVCNSVWEADPNLVIKTKMYEQVSRGTSVQQEIVVKSLSLLDLKDHLWNVIEKGFPHLWNMTWNSTIEKLMYHDFKPNELHFVTDFGALVSNIPQDNLNQAIPNRSIQDIVITAINPRQSEDRIIYDVIDWHVWAQSGETLSNDYFFHYNAMEHILSYIKEEKKQKFDTVLLWSDQCASSFKSRKVAWANLLLAKKFNLKAFLHSYSATGDGKGVHDGSSGDGASKLQQMELKSEVNDRFLCSWDFFKNDGIQKAMGQPPTKTNKQRALEPRSFIFREHVFMADKNDVEAQKKAKTAANSLDKLSSTVVSSSCVSHHDLDISQRLESKQLEHKFPDVRITDRDAEDWDATKINKIMSCFQLLVLREDSGYVMSSPDAGQPALKSDDDSHAWRLYSRQNPCYCKPHCRELNFQNCLHVSDIGSLKYQAIKFVRVRVKPPPVLLSEVSLFFSGTLRASDTKVFLALRNIPKKEMRENDAATSVLDFPFSFAMMTKPPYKLNKQLVVEIDSVNSDRRTVFDAGTEVLHCKVMTDFDADNGQFYFAVGTKSIIVALDAVILPESLQKDVRKNRFNYLGHIEETKKLIEFRNKKETRTVYKFTSETIENIVMSSDASN